jgi:hypothetical protein
MRPDSHREWPTALEAAQFAAQQGRYESADSILASFAGRHAGTTEALETAYWRALFKLDSLDRPEALTPAMALLDSYLADDRPREHVAEAKSLRRIATQLDALNTRALAVMTVPQTREPLSSSRPSELKPSADQVAADAEIKRLKDELAKANAELDRIRRRLTRPPSG